MTSGSEAGILALELALKGRGGFEMVNHHAGDSQVRLLGRVRPPAINSWLVLTNHLLTVSEAEPGWSVDISKSYFRRNSKVVYAWRVIFQGEHVLSRLQAIVNAISAAPRARVVLEEQALPGASGNRNMPSAANKGRGAQSSLKSSVGPMAFAALTRGG